ncbi:helix-turn-helix domain-containing protein [Shewanella sp.]|uniref:helix-turn-helix domain-containing protein n=1 Tax=Shewanella sp. TaxID=50422 RepID=UPI003563EBE6
MILADKIVNLRKLANWSQEELADRMGVSRQSVSKWESANSIPDLNKVILLANLFNVSTDYLLKDEIDSFDTGKASELPDVTLITMEQANHYLECKKSAAELTVKGVLLCVCSVIPLFFFLAMAATQRLGMTNNLAAACGIVGILILVCLGISYLIKTSQFETDTATIDHEQFELSYGVHSAFQEKLNHFTPGYHRRLSLGIFFFVGSFIPLMLGSLFYPGAETIFMMLMVLILMIAAGLYLVIPVSARLDAYSAILRDSLNKTAKARRSEKAKKLAGFYWPFVTAVFLGWSLWTMNWGVTWIIWPVSAVLFAALVGLTELLEKEQR